MPFKNLKRQHPYIWSVFVYMLPIFFFLPPSSQVHAEVLERVVAIVDDEAILLSEFRDALQKTITTNPEKREIDLLNEMIDKRLLLKEARRLISRERADELQDEERLVTEYINIRIKPFVRIPLTEMEYYYMKNKGSFAGRDFYEVKDEIESLLMDEAVRQRLNEHIMELRKKAYIRLQLYEE